jgi:hypothetical protein
MDKASWNAGRPFGATGEYTRGQSEDMDFWKSVLSNHHLRSRFIRDLEVQSISSRSTEDLLHRYREEEILPRGAHSL